MSLLMWSEEGNTQDLSYWFLPPPAQEKASQASDTPAYLDVANYVKAPETKKAETFNFLPIFLAVGILFALGVIKL